MQGREEKLNEAVYIAPESEPIMMKEKIMQYDHTFIKELSEAIGPMTRRPSSDRNVSNWQLINSSNQKLRLLRLVSLFPIFRYSGKV